MTTQDNSILKESAEQRFSYLINKAVRTNKVWLLTDEHGCVMLNSEDEDCVPIWPSEEFAQAWANDEWDHCQPESVSLNKWFSRWTLGLADDELALVIFPDENQEGLVVYPDEFEQALKKEQKKSR